MSPLAISITLSIVLTVALNVALRAFPRSGERLGQKVTQLAEDRPAGRVWVPWKAMIVASLALTVIANLVLWAAR